MGERDPHSDHLRYDRLIKLGLQRFHPDFAAWILGQRPVEVVDVDPILPGVAQREGDKLLDVRLKEGPGVLLHLEFQIEGRPRVRRKMAQFAAFALNLFETEAHRGKLFASAMVYLDEEAYHGDSGNFQVSGALDFRFVVDYKVLRLWTVNQKPGDPHVVLGAEAPGLWPFAALMHGKPEELLVESRNRILGAPEIPFEARQVLLAILLAFAQRRIPDREMLKGFVEEVRAMGKDKNYVFDLLIGEGYEKGLEKGVEKGLAKGLEKGRREGLAGAIRRILLRRFGAGAEETAARVSDIDDLGRLERLLEEAAVAPDLDTFRTTLESEGSVRGSE